MRLFLPAALLLVIASPLRESPKCPVDDGLLRNTFESKMEGGRMFYKWVCPYNRNHVYWIRG